MSETPEFKVGIIIPVYAHSYLVAETLTSALAQDISPKPQILVVNDGCKNPETHVIVKSFAAANPDQVSYVFKPNGGLSSARNAGIDYLLEHQPDLDAVYLLDADNWLEPYAMRRFAETMQESGADWCYPDVDQFGLKGNTSFGGEYRLCIHLDRNICEAGSMVRMDVYRDGLRFDETMTKGFEDWEFWLNCASKGYRGQHVANSGFFYRKRGSSMLADAEAEKETIASYIREKHKTLFAPQTIKSIVASEAPTIAIVDLTRREVLLGEDPLNPTEIIDFQTFKTRIWRSVDSTELYAPPLNIIFSRRSLNTPALRPLLRNIVWHLISERNEHPFRAISLERASGGPSFETQDPSYATPDDITNTAEFLHIGFQTLSGILRDQSTAWVSENLTGSTPSILNRNFKVARLDSSRTQVPLTLQSLTAILELKDPEWMVSAEADFGWREDSGMDTGWIDRFGGSRPGNSPGLPMLVEDLPKVAFVLPIMDFGGVEKVTVNVARVFKDLGWHVSLVILGRSEIFMPFDQFSFVDDLVMLGQLGFSEWSGSTRYMGELVPQADGDTQRLVSVLQNFDAVVNCHSWSLNGVMGSLKRANVITCAYLHLMDETATGRYVGHVNTTLAYEYTYKYLLTCSKTLGYELEGLGVSRSKIIPIPNAAGFRIEDLSNKLQAPAKIRAARTDTKPRLLFLGRLDRQKGLDRLTKLFSATKETADWRFVGKAIIQGAERLDPDIPVEPPVYDCNALEKLYRWCDFFVLLSNFEGLPLALIEAMRAGAVPIATDVGANSELIRHGQNGFLVSLDNAVAETLEILKTAPAQLPRLSEAAQNTARPITWQNQAGPFAQKLWTESWTSKTLDERHQIMAKHRPLETPLEAKK